MGIIYKNGVKKIEIDLPLSQLIPKEIKILPITLKHVEYTLTLPQLHKDPFDRMIIAQAIVENFQLITDDEWIKQYPVLILH